MAARSENQKAKNIAGGSEDAGIREAVNGWIRLFDMLNTKVARYCRDTETGKNNGS
jgi:hypothetical protein